MTRRNLFVFFAALFLAAPVQAGTAEKPPALVVQVRSLERVFDHTKLILSLIGQEEIAGKVEGLLKSKIGPGGLEGVDQKKPFGVVVRFGKDLDDVSPLILVPIADEKAFLKLLESNKLKFTKGKNDLYTAKVGTVIEIEIFFRFSKGYLCATVLNPSAVDPERLPADPAKALGGTEGPAFAATLRLDQVPLTARQLALGEFEKFYAPLLKEKDGGGGKAFHELQMATLEALAEAVKAVLLDGKEATFTLDIQPKTRKLEARLSLTGQKGTDLAKAIAAMGENKSRFAGMISDKALFNAVWNWQMPEKMTKAWGGFFADIKEKAIADLSDKGKQLQARALFAILEPTFKTGHLDAFLHFDVTSAKTLAYVAGVEVKDGKKLEKELRGLVEEARKIMVDKDKIQLDFAKAEGVSIHRLEIPETRDLAALKALLGEAA